MSNGYGFRGNFIAEISKLILENPNVPIAYILREGTRELNRKHGHFMYATDEELYTEFENLDIKFELEDEKMSDEEFQAWADRQFVYEEE